MHARLKKSESAARMVRSTGSRLILLSKANQRIIHLAHDTSRPSATRLQMVRFQANTLVHKAAWFTSRAMVKWATLREITRTHRMRKASHNMLLNVSETLIREADQETDFQLRSSTEPQLPVKLASLCRVLCAIDNHALKIPRWEWRKVMEMTHCISWSRGNGWRSPQVLAESEAIGDDCYDRSRGTDDAEKSVLQIISSIVIEFRFCLYSVAALGLRSRLATKSDALFHPPYSCTFPQKSMLVITVVLSEQDGMKQVDLASCMHSLASKGQSRAF